MKLLVNLCAQDGIISHNSGVGTMVKRYIYALIKYFKDYRIDYFLNLFTPEYNADGFGFSNSTKTNNEQIENTNIFQLSNGSNGKFFFGELKNWEKLCKNTARIINNVDFDNYDFVITLLNDTPFAGVMKLCDFKKNHKIVWLPHSTAKIHLDKQKNPAFEERVKWESEVTYYINNNSNCYFGAVGKFIKQHMIEEYNILPEKTLNIFNGEILSQENIYEEDEESKILFERMNKEGDILLSFSRPEKYKNLDASIKLAQILNIRSVIITQEYFKNMPYVNYLKEISKEANCELFVDVPFHFPQYILKYYPHKIILVVPSKKEIAGLIINEIRRMNRPNILLVVNDIDGLNEQVDDEINGILVDLNDLEKSAEKVRRNFKTEVIEKLNNASLEKLRKDYDFEKTIIYLFNILLKN